MIENCKLCGKEVAVVETEQGERIELDMHVPIYRVEIREKPGGQVGKEVACKIIEWYYVDHKNACQGRNEAETSSPQGIDAQTKKPQNDAGRCFYCGHLTTDHKCEVGHCLHYTLTERGPIRCECMKFIPKEEA
jgi:hypothetical protein